MKRLGILAAGNLLVDHVFLMPHFPDSGTLISITHESRCVGGAPLNVLITLAKMGVVFPLAAAGICGKDENGQYIQNCLKAHQINADFVKEHSELPTSHTFVMTAKDNGQRTFFHELGANSALNVDFFAEIATSHRIFHLGYLLLLAALDCKDAEFGTQSAKLLYHMRQKGYRISLDLVSVSEKERFETWVKPCLPYVDYLIINELEAQMLTGVKIRHEGKVTVDAIFRALETLVQLGVQQTAVIHCPEGGFALSKDKNGTWHSAAQNAYPLDPTEIKGTVGAGDAFCAGMLFALHENLGIEEALKIANACAWFNLHAANSVDGTQSLAAIQRFIAGRPPKQ